MQTKGLHKNIYKLAHYACTAELIEKHLSRYQPIVDKWESLREKGTPLAALQEAVGISRATYYRYKRIIGDLLEKNIIPPSKRHLKLNKPKWGESEKQLVLHIRRENPTYGKEKIGVILKRDHDSTMSISTVGRILKFLKTKGLVIKSRSAVRARRHRAFDKHAKRWTYKDYKDMVLGERVQIDHMTVSRNGITVKHFQAWERKSKFIFAAVYSQATAKSAKRFLLELLKQVPFPILSIQVDGGSEFRAEFEDACADLNLELMVLPPKKPKYNGGVERGNRIFQDEFYYDPRMQEDSVRGIQASLTKALHKYNHYRPHKALHNLTPMCYIQNCISETPSQSHML